MSLSSADSPSHMSFMIKKNLGENMRVSRPTPNWIHMRLITPLAYMSVHQKSCPQSNKSMGEIVLIQFEDFENHSAFEILAKYRKTHLVFNDDIHGTASVFLAGIVSSLKLVSGTLAEHTFLFLGAGEAGTGIAELIALKMSKQTKAPIDETRKKIWLVVSKGLIVKSREESLQHFKEPWAHGHEPIRNLLDAVKLIKLTVLIGSSVVGQTFTKEVVEAMASFNEKPVILALSNPTSQSECTAEQVYGWSNGRAIFASGSPFYLVEFNDKVLKTKDYVQQAVLPMLTIVYIASNYSFVENSAWPYLE
ncbi:hypothetical protein MKW98_027147 [Papaver atlanticum]|uniref:Malic enzyme NAD-binding domain-containing protein n=1 Tax=Papaver atlanticum TaxID=357466 RepID=A0AAD4T3S1_9MAGN|nr:hypothetical protein MKW98_027147 [Papaver atlanticum]